MLNLYANIIIINHITKRGEMCIRDRHYINIVQQKSSLRKLIDASMTAADESYKGEDDADAIIGRAGDAIYRIALKNSQSTVVHIKEALQESYVKISEAMKAQDGMLGIPTGFPYMDQMLSGFQGTQLIIIAGRPGMGKTCLLYTSRCV